MSFDHESIIDALDCSYQGSPEQISQAQQFLLNITSQPNEYSKILIDIMTNGKIPDITRVAASIQFKYLLSNPEISNQFTLDNIISVYIESIPLVQVQLQSIFLQIVNRYLQEDAEQGIEALLSIIEQSFNSSNDELLIGIEIIRFIFQSDTKIFPGIGTKETLASQLIVPQFNALVGVDISTVSPFFIHCLFSTANYLLNFSNLEPLNNWIEIIVNILNQEWELEFDIDVDVTEFSVSIIELKQEFLEPQSATIIFNSIVDRIKKNRMSYKGVLFSFRYIHQFLDCGAFVEELMSQNQPNSIFEFVTEILFELFVLNSNSMQQINEDLLNFILFRHNSDNSPMPETPISGAILVLNDICEKKFFIDEIVEFSLFQLNGNIEMKEDDESSYGKLYGSVHFASILAPYLDASFSEGVIEILNSSIEKNKESEQLSLFQMTTMILFLSNIKIESLDLFILCISNLSNESLPDLIHYFCAISIPNFFTFFKIDEVYSEIESILNLPIFIKNLLELNSSYQTNQISNSIKMIFEYFLVYLEPVSIDVIQELFSIYYQFANEENDKKRTICSSIIKFSNMMKGKDSSIEFYSASIENNLQLLTEIESNDYYELLSVLNNLIKNSIDGISQEDLISLNDLFIQIPELLFDLIEDSFDFVIFPLISNILKKLAIQSLPISEPVSKILQNFISKYENRDESEESFFDCHFLISSINKISQILFIVLNDKENVQLFLNVFTRLNDDVFADSIAAIAFISPAETFSNELNFRICLNKASPAAFLLSFESITQNINDMPQCVMDDQDEIQKIIDFNLDELLGEMDRLEKKNVEMLNGNIKAVNSGGDKGEEQEEGLIILDDDDQDNFNLNEDDDDDLRDDPCIFDFQSIIEFYQS